MNITCPGCDAKLTNPGADCPACGLDLRPFLQALESADIYFNNGLAACRQGDYLTALEELAVARALNPADFEAWRLAGKVCVEMELYQRAVGFFARALKLNSADRESLDALSWLAGQGCEIP